MFTGGQILLALCWPRASKQTEGCGGPAPALSLSALHSTSGSHCLSILLVLLVPAGCQQVLFGGDCPVTGAFPSSLLSHISESVLASWSLPFSLPSLECPYWGGDGEKMCFVERLS